jgi:hypothetical protein
LEINSPGEEINRRADPVVYLFLFLFLFFNKFKNQNQNPRGSVFDWGRKVFTACLCKLYVIGVEF